MSNRDHTILGLSLPLKSLGFKYASKEHMRGLQGKSILVTGGSDGIGKETIKQIAKQNPNRIWMAARSKAKSEAAIAAIRSTSPNARITHIPLDLTSFDSIKSAAQKITSDPNNRLHILITNAGVMACPPGLTSDGYEIQFGINHLGHAYLIDLLLPLLRKTAKEDPSTDVRVIALSGGYEGEFLNPRGIHLEDMKSPDCGGLKPFNRYSQSKLANVTYARALAQKEQEIGSGVKSVVVNPGFVKSGIGRGVVEDHPWMSPIMFLMQFLMFPPLIMSVYQGCQNTLWAASSPDVKSGAFYFPVANEVLGSPWSRSEDLREKLWSWTQDQIRDYSEMREDVKKVEVVDEMKIESVM
ncbi:MAG: hypothetical protein Q9162_005112 [Coniocarpon cinnabarinum]